jgi:hypothetical protein
VVQQVSPPAAVHCHLRLHSASCALAAELQHAKLLTLRGAPDQEPCKPDPSPGPGVAVFTGSRARGADGLPVLGKGKQIALDVARGLAFLHSQHVVHLDLKSPNGAGQLVKSPSKHPAAHIARNNTCTLTAYTLACLHDCLVSS